MRPGATSGDQPQFMPSTMRMGSFTGTSAGRPPVGAEGSSFRSKSPIPDQSYTSKYTTSGTNFQGMGDSNFSNTN